MAPVTYETQNLALHRTLIQAGSAMDSTSCAGGSVRKCPLASPPRQLMACTSKPRRSNAARARAARAVSLAAIACSNSQKRTVGGSVRKLPLASPAFLARSLSAIASTSRLEISNLRPQGHVTRILFPLSLLILMARFLRRYPSRPPPLFCFCQCEPCGGVLLTFHPSIWTIVFR